MYRIMQVKGGKSTRSEEESVRKVKWEEMVTVMELLEKKFGWEAQDGRKAYTSDESESHKSMVLGEFPPTASRRVPGTFRSVDRVTDLARRRLSYL